MRGPALLAVAVLVTVAACSGGVTPPAPRSGPVAGGYRTVSASDPSVAAAEALAISEIYRRDPQRSIVERVSREAQVVAGMNYRFVIEMSGSGTYRIIVFKPLDGDMEVTSFEKFVASN